MVLHRSPLSIVDVQVAVGPYVAGMVRELEGAGRDARADMLRAGRPNAFPSAPETSCKMWDHLQNLDPRTLLLTQVITGTHSIWARAVKEACTSVRIYPGGLFRNLEARESGISRTQHARRILFPRQRLMRMLQEFEDLDDAELVRRGAVYADRYKRRFVQGLDNGASLEEDLDLMEMFHDVAVLDNKWSSCVLFRCVCKHCMRSAVCAHSVLCGMVCDPGITIPAEYVHGKVQLRRSRGRPAKRRLQEVSEAVEGDCRETVAMPTGYRAPTVLDWCVLPCDSSV